MTENQTCSNYHNALYANENVDSFYIKLFVFAGMLISVIFIPTHLFLLYVTDNVESVKGKNFMSLMVMLLIKYLLILLNTTLDIPNLVKFPNLMIFGLVYAHLSATCWLCIVAAHSLNIVKKRIWKTYNVRWISISISSILGWILPCFFLLSAYISTISVEDELCKARCDSNACHANVFYAIFELIRLFLLIKCAIDIIRVRYYKSYMISAVNIDSNDETFVSDVDYINFGVVFYVVFCISWVVEIAFYFVRTNSAVAVTSVASSVEAILVVLGTLWWKKCFSSANVS